MVGLPAGQRPFRTHIDPSRDGSEVVSAVSDRIRTEFYGRIGIAELLPDQGSPAETFLATLEGLDPAAAASADNLVAAKVAMRLQSLLTSWKEGGAATDVPSPDPAAGRPVTDTLQAASDDELFAFINRDLGRS